MGKRRLGGTAREESAANRGVGAGLIRVVKALCERPVRAYGVALARMVGPMDLLWSHIRRYIGR